ncbi:hypothetical protein SGFS_103790 [Streptomyces graminofaciens]|uniref:Uncharacterized protein n=1 Tax=Streptomyces graminofaciens TaxID=68212 RepID=A0ABN5W0V0_9ACTN|nr:hypothetical protein SGFS_103790 [Streptomyces graminofaciens]
MPWTRRQASALRCAAATGLILALRVDAGARRTASARAAVTLAAATGASMCPTCSAQARIHALKWGRRPPGAEFADLDTLRDSHQMREARILCELPDKPQVRPIRGLAAAFTGSTGWGGV